MFYLNNYEVTEGGWRFPSGSFPSSESAVVLVRTALRDWNQNESIRNILM